MATIIYGRSVMADNAKTRRHQRRRKAAIMRQHIEKIIDAALGISEIFPPPLSKAEMICKRKALKRPLKAIRIANIHRYRDTVETVDYRWPDMAISRTGHRRLKPIIADN